MNLLFIWTYTNLICAYRIEQCRRVIFNNIELKNGKYYTFKLKEDNKITISCYRATDKLDLDDIKNWMPGKKNLLSELVNKQREKISNEGFTLNFYNNEISNDLDPENSRPKQLCEIDNKIYYILHLALYKNENKSIKDDFKNKILEIMLGKNQKYKILNYFSHDNLENPPPIIFLCTDEKRALEYEILYDVFKECFYTSFGKRDYICLRRFRVDYFSEDYNFGLDFEHFILYIPYIRHGLLNFHEYRIKIKDIIFKDTITTHKLENRPSIPSESGNDDIKDGDKHLSCYEALFPFVFVKIIAGNVKNIDLFRRGVFCDYDFKYIRDASVDIDEYLSKVNSFQSIVKTNYFEEIKSFSYNPNEYFSKDNFMSFDEIVKLTSNLQQLLNMLPELINHYDDYMKKFFDDMECSLTVIKDQMLELYNAYGLNLFGDNNLENPNISVQRSLFRNLYGDFVKKFIENHDKFIELHQKAEEQFTTLVLFADHFLQGGLFYEVLKDLTLVFRDNFYKLACDVENYRVKHATD